MAFITSYWQICISDAKLGLCSSKPGVFAITQIEVLPPILEYHYLSSNTILHRYTWLNDLRFSLKRSVVSYLADDTSIEYAIKKMKYLETVLNQDLKMTSDE